MVNKYPNISKYPCFSKQLFSLSKDPHFRLSTYLHMAFWRLRHQGQTVEIFTYLRDHVDSQKQPSLCPHDCLSSAKIHFFRNWGCGLLLGPLREAQQGVQVQHQQHPYELGPCRASCRTTCPPSHLTLIQTGSWPCALKTKLREKRKHLGSLQLNTQEEEGLLLAPRLHSLLPLHSALCLPHRRAAFPQEKLYPLL